MSPMPGLWRGRSGCGKTRQPHEGVHLRITATHTQDHHAINVPVSRRRRRRRRRTPGRLGPTATVARHRRRVKAGAGSTAHTVPGDFRAADICATRPCRRAQMTPCVRHRRPAPKGPPPVQNGGSACVLPDFCITQRDAACRRSPMPTVGAVWRDWSGGRRRARYPSMLRARAAGRRRLDRA
jgi:hypothetical protein